MKKVVFFLIVVLLALGADLNAQPLEFELEFCRLVCDFEAPPIAPVPPPPPPTEPENPSGTTSFEDGVFRWRQANPVQPVLPNPLRFDQKIPMPDPGLIVDFVRLEVDVEIASWDQRGGSKGHSVLWLHRGLTSAGRWPGNVIAYTDLFGPSVLGFRGNANIGLGRREGRSKRRSVSVPDVAGRPKVHAVFEYRAGTGWSLEVSGDVKASLRWSGRNKPPPFAAGAEWYLVFGHELKGEDDPVGRTADWIYWAKLCVEFQGASGSCP